MNTSTQEPKQIAAARPKIAAALLERPSPKHSSLVAKAMFTQQDFPQQAYEWPIVEVVGTTVLRGGGESTSWHPHSTIRVNGKQVFREETSYSGATPLQLFFGDRLVKVTRDRQSDIYVLRPE